VAHTLYEILVKARLKYDEKYSPYICDCITSVEDEIHGRYIPTYPLTRPLLDFIKADIKDKFSVIEYLFPGLHAGNLNKQQQEQVLEYREQLWKSLFDFAKEQEQ